MRWPPRLKDPVAANSFVLFLSEGTSSALMMATGFLVARFLTVADFGKFTAALAFATILNVFVDSGMGMVAAKDIAKNTTADRRQLDQIFSWRLGLILLTSLLAPLIARLTFPPGEVQDIAVWLTPGVLLVGITDFFCWIFKGAQKAVWCAGLQLSSRTSLLILSLIALTRPHALPALIVAYAVSGLLMTVVGVFVLGHSMHALRLARLPETFFQKTLPDIYRMGAILILSVIFTRVDLMIVTRLLGDVQAGLFAAAGRVLDAIRLVPMVVYSVYLPVFSAFHDQPEQLRVRFQAAQRGLLVLSLAIALIGYVFAAPLFTLILGPAYQGSVACFRLLVWTCVLMFSNILMFCLLYALNDHRTPILAIVGALALEVILDFILVPRLGIVGASWARIFAELLNYGVMGWGLIKTGFLWPRAFKPAAV